MAAKRNFMLTGAIIGGTVGLIVWLAFFVVAARATGQSLSGAKSIHSAELRSALSPEDVLKRFRQIPPNSKLRISPDYSAPNTDICFDWTPDLSTYGFLFPVQVHPDGSGGSKIEVRMIPRMSLAGGNNAVRNKFMGRATAILQDLLK